MNCLWDFICCVIFMRVRLKHINHLVCLTMDPQAGCWVLVFRSNGHRAGESSPSSPGPPNFSQESSGQRSQGTQMGSGSLNLLGCLRWAPSNASMLLQCFVLFLSLLFFLGGGPSFSKRWVFVQWRNLALRSGLLFLRWASSRGRVSPLAKWALEAIELLAEHSAEAEAKRINASLKKLV